MASHHLINSVKASSLLTTTLAPVIVFEPVYVVLLVAALDQGYSLVMIKVIVKTLLRTLSYPLANLFYDHPNLNIS